MGGQPSLPALVPSDVSSQSSSLCYSNATRGGVEGRGDMLLPTAVFPSFSAAA